MNVPWCRIPEQIANLLAPPPFGSIARKTQLVLLDGGVRGACNKDWIACLSKRPDESSVMMPIDSRSKRVWLFLYKACTIRCFSFDFHAGLSSATCGHFEGSFSS